MRVMGLWSAVGFLLFISGASASAAPHDTLNNQLVVGFQGWFMCPGDGRPGGGWVHWFAGNKPDAAHFSVELMPDTSELQPGRALPDRTYLGQWPGLFVFRPEPEDRCCVSSNGCGNTISTWPHSSASSSVSIRSTRWEDALFGIACSTTR